MINYLIGDWGLGIGDWAIPNPQSPIPNPLHILTKKCKLKFNYILEIK